jgi:NAD-dependent deacetylase
VKGALARPDVVWFGEVLPQEAIDSALAAARSCDFCFSVGTTSLVQPAASLPLVAMEKGAALVEVNPMETPLSPQASQCIRATASQSLAAIAGQLAAASGMD